jgi:hypothetical protein
MDGRSMDSRGMDVIDSGPQRPVGRGARMLRRAVAPAVRRLVRADQRQRQTAAVLAGVVLAAGSVAALRAGLPQPVAARGPTWAALSGPPYDRLPGRTPIPPPRLISEDGQLVSGELPASTLSPSRAAVRQAVALVLGRYCRDPAAHTVQLIEEQYLPYPYPRAGRGPGIGPGRAPLPPLGPTRAPAPTGSPLPTPSAPPFPTPAPAGSWQFATALVSAADTGAAEVGLTLRWTGYTYRWRASLAQLDGCR